MSRILEMLREGDANYHPLVAIKGIASRTIDERLEFDCHKTIAKYVESERRSIEVKTEDGAELINMRINLSNE